VDFLRPAHQAKVSNNIATQRQVTGQSAPHACPAVDRSGEHRRCSTEMGRHLRQGGPALRKTREHQPHTTGTEQCGKDQTADGTHELA
jgi:hypothetical protein